MILLLAGLPGTGKSYLARALAPRLDADILDRDAIRNALFPARDLDFSRKQNELASQILYRVAEYVLHLNPARTLIFDGRPFSRVIQIDEVAALAERVETPLRIVLVTAPEAIVQQRLHADLHTPSAIPIDNRKEKYWRDKAAFEPITRPHLAVDTSSPTEETLACILEWLAANA